MIMSGILCKAQVLKGRDGSSDGWLVMFGDDHPWDAGMVGLSIANH